MGVRGLCSFFDENPSLLKDFKLHDTKVVVDGNNLLHRLYFNGRLNCIYGGDYNKFSRILEKYFDAYTQCNVEPIIVFDGGYDKNDRKLKTVLKRKHQLINNVQHIVRTGNNCNNVLPILAKEVMKDVLKALNINYVQCDYEADDRITAIANYYQCPVISQDSDFYIYDIYHGYIRLDLLCDDISYETNERGKKLAYLSCSIYYINNFLCFFPRISKNHLPLFATLIGNDYVSISMFENFFMQIKLPKFKKKLRVNQRHKKMIGLLEWLQDQDIDEAIKLVLSHLKSKKRQHVESIIQQAVDSYRIQQSTYDTAKGLSDLMSLLEKHPPTTFHENALPGWFVKRSREGGISPFILNATGLHRTFLPMQVEDLSTDGSSKCSLYVRQIMYGILLSHDLKSSPKSISPEDCIVTEYGLCNCHLKTDPIEPIFSMEGYGDVPTLDELHEIDGKSFLLRVIAEKEEYLTTWPKEVQLLIGIIRFWLRNSSPKPCEAFFQSLLVQILYYIGNATPKSENLQSKDSKVDLIFSEVYSVEFQYFQDRMKKHLQKPKHNNANPLNIKMVHCFSQLQTCILHILQLNNLLGDPFCSTQIHNFFGGTLLYNFTMDVLSRTYPELYISEVLCRDSNLCELYRTLKQSILTGLSENELFQEKQPTKIKKKPRKNSGSVANTLSTVDSDMQRNKFELLSCME